MSFSPVEVPFPMAIDNSMRTAFVACPQKFYYQYMKHLQNDSIHLIAGASFAYGLETFRKLFYGEKYSFEAARNDALLALIRHYGETEAPEGSAKSWDGVAAAFLAYITQYTPLCDFVQPLMIDGKPCVEFTFAIPIPDTHHPETGEPIIYCGRFDMLGEFQGLTWIVDEKTTGQLGPRWADQWQIKSQFAGYSWACREYGFDVAGAIIRAVSIQKTQIKFAHPYVYYQQWQLDRWLFQLKRDVNRMIECWKLGYFDFSLDLACTSYGGCEFLPLCTVKDPEPWFNDYEVRQWNPLEIVREDKYSGTKLSNNKA